MSGVVFLLLRLILVVALYAFLGWALWTIRRDIKNRGEEYIDQGEARLYLLVDNDGTLQTLRFSGMEISIGRDPSCDCTLSSDRVSARHAFLHYHHNQWWIEDLGSTNGTYLNGDAVSSPVVVAPGDSLRCGDVELIVNFSIQMMSDGV